MTLEIMSVKHRAKPCAAAYTYLQRVWPTAFELESPTLTDDLVSTSLACYQAAMPVSCALLGGLDGMDVAAWFQLEPDQK